MAQTPRCTLNGGSFKPPLGVCTIYSQSTIFELYSTALPGMPSPDQVWLWSDFLVVIWRGSAWDRVWWGCQAVELTPLQVEPFRLPVKDPPWNDPVIR